MDQDGALGIEATVSTSSEAFNLLLDKLNQPVSVTMEAGRNYWWIKQHFKAHPAVKQVKVVDPMNSRTLSKELAVLAGYGRAKNDRIDAEMLAELERLGLTKSINMPNEQQLANRSISRQRFELIKQRTRSKNHIQALLAMHGVRAATNKLVESEETRASVFARLPDFVTFIIQQDIEKIWFMNDKIKECEKRLDTLLPKNNKDIDILCSAPGIGIILARIILTEIVDITHFDAPKHLISYAGLAPVVNESGRHKGKVRLNEHANHYLKYALIEAAHGARNYPKYKDKYRKDVKERDRITAKITLARRLAKSVFWMLTRQQYFKD
jgi:transposase